MLIKLTKDNYFAAGKAIMADARCNSEVKAGVHRGTSGEVDSNGLYSYYTNDHLTWYDNILIAHAVKGGSDA